LLWFRSTVYFSIVMLSVLLVGRPVCHIVMLFVVLNEVLFDSIVVCGRAYAYRVGPTLVWPFCRSCHACVGSLCGTFPAYRGFFYRNDNGIRTGENERCIGFVTGQLEKRTWARPPCCALPHVDSVMQNRACGSARCVVIQVPES
jgi:hypothetical protein